MIESYKNVERLRYRLHVDLVEIGDLIDRNSSSRFDELINQVTSGIIAAISASIITETSFEKFKGWLLNEWLSKTCLKSNLAELFGLIISVLIYVMMCVFMYIMVKKISYRWKKRAESHKPIRQKEINYQKQFDNIACDSLLVAIEYVQILEQNKEMNDINKAFYAVECIHYIDVASRVTRDLCIYKKKYVKLNQLEGVDVYRIHIMKDALDYAINAVERSIKKIKFTDGKDKEALMTKVQEISEIIETIKL